MDAASQHSLPPPPATPSHEEPSSLSSSSSRFPVPPSPSPSRGDGPSSSFGQAPPPPPPTRQPLGYPHNLLSGPVPPASTSSSSTPAANSQTASPAPPAGPPGLAALPAVYALPSSYPTLPPPPALPRSPSGHRLAAAAPSYYPQYDTSPRHHHQSPAPPGYPPSSSPHPGYLPPAPTPPARNSYQPLFPAYGGGYERGFHSGLQAAGGIVPVSVPPGLGAGASGSPGIAGRPENSESGASSYFQPSPAAGATGHAPFYHATPPHHPHHHPQHYAASSSYPPSTNGSPAPSQLDDAAPANMSGAAGPPTKKPKKRAAPGEDSLTCHQCRGYYDGALRCSKIKGAKKKQCILVFCDKDAVNRYGLDPAAIRARGPPMEEDILAGHSPEAKYAWTCPSCEDICQCSVCRKRKGLDPIGNLSFMAKQTGAGSTAELLRQNPSAQGTMKRPRGSGASGDASTGAIAKSRGSSRGNGVGDAGAGGGSSSSLCRATAPPSNTPDFGVDLDPEMPPEERMAILKTREKRWKLTEEAKARCKRLRGEVLDKTLPAWDDEEGVTVGAVDEVGWEEPEDAGKGAEGIAPRVQLREFFWRFRTLVPLPEKIFTSLDAFDKPVTDAGARRMALSMVEYLLSEAGALDEPLLPPEAEGEDDDDAEAMAYISPYVEALTTAKTALSKTPITTRQLQAVLGTLVDSLSAVEEEEVAAEQEEAEPEEEAEELAEPEPEPEKKKAKNKAEGNGAAMKKEAEAEEEEKEEEKEEEEKRDVAPDVSVKSSSSRKTSKAGARTRSSTSDLPHGNGKSNGVNSSVSSITNGNGHSSAAAVVEPPAVSTPPPSPPSRSVVSLLLALINPILSTAGIRAELDDALNRRSELLKAQARELKALLDATAKERVERDGKFKSATLNPEEKEALKKESDDVIARAHQAHLELLHTHREALLPLTGRSQVVIGSDIEDRLYLTLTADWEGRKPHSWGYGLHVYGRPFPAELWSNKADDLAATAAMAGIDDPMAPVAAAVNGGDVEMADVSTNADEESERASEKEPHESLSPASDIDVPARPISPPPAPFVSKSGSGSTASKSTEATPATATMDEAAAPRWHHFTSSKALRRLQTLISYQSLELALSRGDLVLMQHLPTSTSPSQRTYPDDAWYHADTLVGEFAEEGKVKELLRKIWELSEEIKRGEVEEEEKEKEKEKRVKGEGKRMEKEGAAVAGAEGTPGAVDTANGATDGPEKGSKRRRVSKAK